MKHITIEQRYTIQTMLKAGFSKVKIVKIIGKHKSVIYREIERNCDKRSGEYRHDLAQRKYNNRQKEKPKKIYFTAEIRDNVETLLKEDFSPEQIVGHLHKQNIAVVSVERIYQHIWKDKACNGTLYTHLRNQGRKYRKRGNKKDNRGIIKNRISIDQRPEIVEKRTRFGDLEVDLIIGKNHKQAIVTINDRASGMLKMRKVLSKNATEVSSVITEALKEWKPYIFTMTADNGKEFAEHEFVAEHLNIDHYFAHPYHSWERGSNENLNGLIRQYFKKSSDFTSITNQDILEVENKLNNRPRKRFNYENPIFVMEKLLFNQTVAFVT